LFVEEIGGNLLDASLTGGFFALAAGITTLIAGKFADKNKRDDLIVAFGYTVLGVGFVLYIFVNSIWFLFGVQILIGFSEAFYTPAFDSLYSEHITRKKVGREWGAWESMNYFAIAIGAGVGGLVVSNFGFDVIFIVMAALCFISALYIFNLKKTAL